ncbi:conserved oligomeric golgi complex subunit 8-like [Lichtheimia corymbifera JMRC:FSU:9682]|uniref:Conserved oligomeric Golgi complex subunit 8 n=1 Tax=Lichtheimia corymbifera JMRC:FSU:9682 TaxID=1263082 RepID=A0A068RVJ1_9FUNG|nr:conserved oligomeric golgi complex subunit 8-like [Lichtheimia corymbifera JMRC:FSU:9682]
MTDLDGNEALLHLLDETWEENQRITVHNSKWTRDYLTRLTSLSLDELLHEPSDLRVERESLQKDAQQLAFHDYPAFIHANTCRHQVSSTLDELQSHLDGFVTSVPGLQEACQSFSDIAGEIVEERNKITRVIEQQSVLVDLLEIPQLMETCVWNGYYSEAMDLASHVRLLLVRYPLPIVQSIQRQVQASVDLMLLQLVSHLQRPIKLAAAMNVMGHLRRMDAFDSEIELRMVFLRCRHDYLTQRLERIKRGKSPNEHEEAFEYVKRYIDVMREQMFEIATQYMSIFSQQEQQSILILSDYMIHLLNTIHTLLTTELPKITDTSALASLLTQLQYCGMSLGRVGIDFRHLYVHVFEDTVRPLILKTVDKATEELVTIITTNKAPPNTWMLTNRYTTYQQQQQIADNEHGNTHPHQPPMLLVDYPPLAVFTNAILSAFNSLRLLPAISLLQPVSSHLDACFLEIGSALKQYVDNAESTMPHEMTSVRSFVLAYVRCCVPFLRDCLFSGIYVDIQHESDINDKDLEALFDLKSDEQIESTAGNDTLEEHVVTNASAHETEEEEKETADSPISVDSGSDDKGLANDVLPSNDDKDYDNDKQPGNQEDEKTTATEAQKVQADGGHMSQTGSDTSKPQLEFDEAQPKLEDENETTGKDGNTAIDDSTSPKPRGKKAKGKSKGSRRRQH